MSDRQTAGRAQTTASLPASPDRGRVLTLGPPYIRERYGAAWS